MSGFPGTSLKATPLHALCHELGAKMAPLSGNDLHVRYSRTIPADCHHARSACVVILSVDPHRYFRG